MIENDEYDGLTRFGGRPLRHFPAGKPRQRNKPRLASDWDALPPLADVESWAWRVGAVDYDGPEYDDVFQAFRKQVDTTRVRAYVIGNWEISGWHGFSADQHIRSLADAAAGFPALTAVFVADISQREQEISWITQGDLTPLLTAYPALEVLGARGGNSLGFGPLRHTALRELTFQTGGLNPQVVRNIGASDLPALTDLELYLGSDEYGGVADAADLADILAGTRLPALRYLGLRDAENIDELCAAIAIAPIVAQLEVLDLSLGNLSDAGAAALLAGQPLTHLRKLDLHHHYLSDEMAARIEEALPDVEVDLNDWQEPDEDDDDDEDGTVWRYIAVAE